MTSSSLGLQQLKGTPQASREPTASLEQLKYTFMFQSCIDPMVRSVTTELVSHLGTLDTTALEPALLDPVYQVLLVRIVPVVDNEGLEA